MFSALLPLEFQRKVLQLLMTRKIIGVFVNYFDTSFQHKVSASLAEYAKERGYNLLFFNTFSNHNSNSEYDVLEQELFTVAPIEQLDAVVLLPDTFHIKEHYKRLLLVLKSRLRKDIPVVSIRYRQEGCYQVLVDERHSLEGIIRHVIDVHKCKRICYMGGTLGNRDAASRFECFKELMAEYGLPILSNTVFHGDFWKHDGEKAANYFYSNPENVPDAIICANDYMAIALANVLTARGIRVPEDVIITGYDDIPDARSYVPSITTVEVDYALMAKRTIEIIDRHFNNIKSEPVEYISTILKCRESCGCMTHAGSEIRDMRKMMFEQNDVLFNTFMWHAYFSVDMTGCPDFITLRGQIISVLSHYPHFKDFYMMLCVQENADIAETQYTSAPAKHMRLMVAVKDGQPVHDAEYEEKAFFIDRSELLPAFAFSDEPCCFYIVLLHNKRDCFGYTAISFEDFFTYDFDYQMWTIMISNAISDLVNRMRLERALLKNEQMSITDPLTGLLNRRGFEIFARKLIDGRAENAAYVIAASCDLDFLKRINDRYGHAEGDYAICQIAACIRRVFGVSGVVSRSGGDEFIAMLTAETGDTERYRLDFDKAILAVNEQSNKPYRIDASMGICVQPIEMFSTVEDIIRTSDQLLYREKALKRRRASDLEEGR